MESVEVIVVDGGSTDETLEIAREFDVKILFNPLRTGEAGKSVGLLAATKDLVAFIDSDNILPSENWLKRMVAPFEDEEDIMGAEPFAFTYRKRDPLISRYVALFGVCDPLQLYVGNRDRWNWVKQNWTDNTSHEIVDKGSYYLVKLKRGMLIPCIGANGFVGRRELLLKTNCEPYYFDIDVVYELVQMGFNKVAMVKTGIVHLHADNVTAFVRKAYRRIRDYRQFLKYRKYPWRTGMKGITKFTLSTVALLPVVSEALKGYRKEPDKTWLFHPVICLLVLLTYALTYPLKRATF
jgi:glycosyltransferase involved in cell wall biosynthesis